MNSTRVRELVVGGRSPPTPIPLAAAKNHYQWFFWKLPFRGLPSAWLITWTGNFIGLHLSSTHQMFALAYHTFSKHVWHGDSAPGPAVAKLHLAAASDLFSSTQAYPGQTLLFGITELRAWFWILVHCLPWLHKLSLHQPDGLKCVLTSTSVVSYRAFGKCSLNMFWIERFTEQEELSDITSWHQYCVASVFGRGWGARGAGVTSLKPFCTYISPNENPAESKHNLPCVSPPQEGYRAGIRTDALGSFSKAHHLFTK